MSLERMGRAVWVAMIMAGGMCPAPLAWAQSLEVANTAEVSREVATRVERLATALEAQDPDLAREIKTQGQECLRDLSDGTLDNPEFAKEVESLREVQREVTGRVVQKEVEARLAEFTKAGKGEVAEQMRAAFHAWQGGQGEGGTGRPMGGPEMFRGGPLEGPGGLSEMSRGDAKVVFDRAYQEVLAHDPDGAARMKEMFETVERGETLRPTPEMMERMHQEMERYVSERPEMADYARAEWDRFTDLGPDRGERYGPTGTPEQAREAFDRWAADTTSTGRSQAEVDKMRADFEHSMARGDNPWEHANELGGPEMRGLEREYGDPHEAFERWAAESGRDPLEVERTRETMERYVDDRLSNRAEVTVVSEIFQSREAHVADHNGDGIPETTFHDTYLHVKSDGTTEPHVHHVP